MKFHKKKSLDQINSDTKNKHFERVSIIPRNRSYEFDIVTIKNLLYLTTGQALMTKLGQKGQIYKDIQIICNQYKNKLKLKHLIYRYKIICMTLLKSFLTMIGLNCVQFDRGSRFSTTVSRNILSSKTH